MGAEMEPKRAQIQTEMKTSIFGPVEDEELARMMMSSPIFERINYETPFGWTMREIEKIRWNFLRTPHGSSSCPVPGRARPVHSSTRLEITISHTILDAGRGHRWFFFTTLFRFLFFRVYYHQWKKETNRGSWASSQIVVGDIVAKVKALICCLTLWRAHIFNIARWFCCAICHHSPARTFSQFNVSTISRSPQFLCSNLGKISLAIMTFENFRNVTRTWFLKKTFCGGKKPCSKTNRIVVQTCSWAGNKDQWVLKRREC